MTEQWPTIVKWRPFASYNLLKTIHGDKDKQCKPVFLWINNDDCTRMKNRRRSGGCPRYLVAANPIKFPAGEGRGEQGRRGESRGEVCRWICQSATPLCITLLCSVSVHILYSVLHFIQYNMLYKIEWWDIVGCNDWESKASHLMANFFSRSASTVAQSSSEGLRVAKRWSCDH